MEKLLQRLAEIKCNLSEETIPIDVAIIKLIDVIAEFIKMRKGTLYTQVVQKKKKRKK